MHDKNGKKVGEQFFRHPSNRTPNLLVQPPLCGGRYDHGGRAVMKRSTSLNLAMEAVADIVLVDGALQGDGLLRSNGLQVSKLADGKVRLPLLFPTIHRRCGKSLGDS